MKEVQPSATLLGLGLPVRLNAEGKVEVRSTDPELLIEEAGRVAYKSEDKIAPGSAKRFISMLLKRAHHSVLEHSAATISIVCDRGVSHELVRHRLASYTQESTRYCNYAQDKFGGEITVIRPDFVVEGSNARWERVHKVVEEEYLAMVREGETPQNARSVLTNSLKTEVVITANFREKRWIRKMRTALDAHPAMQKTMIPVMKILKAVAPTVFGEEPKTLPPITSNPGPGKVTGFGP